MSEKVFTESRYRHDSDELCLLADWIDERLAEQMKVHKREDIALDYFRLADRLEQLAEICREFARMNVKPIP